MSLNQLAQIMRWERRFRPADRFNLWCDLCLLPSAYELTVEWSDPDTGEVMDRCRFSWCPDCERGRKWDINDPEHQEAR